MLMPGAVVVIVEWAWERIDEATARWLFDRVPAEANSGWAGERRDNWQASGLPWPEYRDRWAQEHGLHSWNSVESALGNRFDTVLREDVPSLFGDVAEISEATERAAIAGGEIVDHRGSLGWPAPRPQDWAMTSIGYERKDGRLTTIAS